MATTLQIESGLMATAPPKSLTAHIVKVLQSCDTLVDKVQSLLLTRWLFQKEQPTDHHLNLLLELTEHESTCNKQANPSHAEMPTAYAGSKVYGDGKEIFSNRKNVSVTSRK